MSPCTTSLGETGDLILGDGRALAREDGSSPVEALGRRSVSVEPMGHLADDAIGAVL